MDGEYLRKKARTLNLLASGCFDTYTAQKLRQLADEFQTTADRCEDFDVPAPFMFRNGGRESGGGLDRH